MFRFIYISLLFFTCSLLSAQQVQKAQTGTFLLKGGTIHTITNGVIVGDILISDQKIVDISSSIANTTATLINCTDKHIYPGFIDSGCRLGLAEIESISLSNDFNELGDFIPHMKALTAVNPNSVSIPITRVNGVTTVFTKPQGSSFPGTGAVIDLFGYTPDYMFTGAEGVILNFPSTGRRGRYDRRSDEDIEKDSKKAMNKLNDIWNELTHYHKIDSMTNIAKEILHVNNPQLKSLLPVFRQKSKLFIEVNAKEDIIKAIEWCKEHAVQAVLMGVAEGWRVTKEIKASNFPVITGPILSVPGREHDRYDVSYTNAAKMQKAGIKVAIRTNEAENTRNLPFNAGFAAAYGLGIEEALKSITIYPAQIFGIDNLYGSIEKGKMANIFVSDGDPFETKTKIQHLFIKGWKIPLESRQTLLNDEFLERIPAK